MLLSIIAATVGFASVAAGQASDPGRIVGRVVDRGTGRPLASVRVTIVGQTGAVETDLDGRFRSGPVPPGTHSLRAALIGYRPVAVDSIAVEAGRTATVTVALESAPLQLEELTVAAAVPQRAATDAGLLAQQQAAPTVSDGLSAETMRRSPDSDAGDAIARVTGISVVDRKFVVVRGLSERYSSTMLNGAPLPSPEPLRKVVPLDVFPSSLLESIVTTKGATPDKPGDFAGGMVEIKTKEFPEEFTAQLKVSQEYNSNSTFEMAALAPRGGTDFLGIDDGRRGVPDFNPSDAASTVRFAEQIRNVWSPEPRRIRPNTGFGANVGGQVFLGDTPIGAVAAFTYSAKGDLQVDRVFQFVSGRETGEVPIGSLFEDATVTVDWGALANLSTRLGTYHKLGFKNFYSRNAEELVSQSSGFDRENGYLLRRFQVRYVERDLLQSQLSGEHYLPGLGDSRLEWKATYSVANRDEPENRNALYQPSLGPTGIRLPTNQTNRSWFRFLDDRVYSGQLDWALPISLRSTGDAEFKVGAAVSQKGRQFSVIGLSYQVNPVLPDGQEVLDLPPEQLFAPENIGRNIGVTPTLGNSTAYEVDDNLYAAYAMVDFELIPRLRMVGGLRVEDWRLDLYQNTKADPLGDPVVRRNRDYLWSANLTASVTDAVNFRFSASRTLNRPDSRELSRDEYAAIGGECVNQGNPDLQRAAILNFDARWELYPRAGELIAVSGFYKRFSDPVVETVDQPSGGSCRVTYRNADRGSNLGAEFEFRKVLDFLPGALGNLAAGLNLTLVRSRVSLGEGFVQGDLALPLLGQSPAVVNANLGYLDTSARLDASVLVNFFDDRVVRYGLATSVNPPHVTERGRVTLDAKVEKGIGPLSVSLSGKNLTNNRFELFQETDLGPIVTGLTRPGRAIALGVGYVF
ncbi:MAG: TonB-dependent receptor [Gemmatimonadales bacterium]